LESQVEKIETQPRLYFKKDSNARAHSPIAINDTPVSLDSEPIIPNTITATPIARAIALKAILMVLFMCPSSR
jgi:hypothetical protein